MKNVVLENVELECQDNATLIEILLILVNQVSTSDVKIKFYDF